MASSVGVVKSGWIFKRGAVFKTWRRRWLVLTLDEVQYYDVPGGHLKGTILLNAAIAFIHSECKRQPAFGITVSNRTYEISTDTQELAAAWVNKIREVISAVHSKVTVSDFENIKLLGRGSYGKVFLVRFIRTGQLFAMKTLSKKKLVNFDLIGRTEAERNVLIRANHPFLVSARWSFQSESKAFLVMDYVAGGDLGARLAKEGRFDEERTRIYAAELILAISYLHEIGVIHRDLTPGNILLDDGGHVRIADFGFVKEKMNGQTTETFCGTPQYIAPEIIGNKPYNHMCDWWSLGILIFEMLYSKPPWHDPNVNSIFKSILYGEIKFPPEANQEAVSLVRGFCVKDPGKRLGVNGIHEIQVHPFFAGLDWAVVLEKHTDLKWAIGGSGKEGDVEIEYGGGEGRKSKGKEEGGGGKAKEEEDGDELPRIRGFSLMMDDPAEDRLHY
jgi:hypothetical protein